MSAGWEIGDVAVCVDAKPEASRKHTLLTEGAVYTVSGFITSPSGELGLTLAGVVGTRPGPHFGKEGPYRSSRFRKIRPDTHERCEDDFITLLKRSRKAVSA